MECFEEVPPDLLGQRMEVDGSCWQQVKEFRAGLGRLGAFQLRQLGALVGLFGAEFR
ncbi:hypothetical protein [Actinomadura sp. SCN-SB]|uniref:hypothetical protein n=1 Tax=Actinomadura sp. SCN-SB TaxID=3373092 RepID=UPI003750FE28